MASANRHVDLVLGTSLGGVGRHVKALAEALQQESAAVAVHGPAATESTFAFTRSGAAFEAVDIPVGLAPVRALRAGRALREQLLAADLVHTHGLRAGVLAARARRKMRSRKTWSFVATWHNVPQSAPRFAALQHRLEVRLALAADVSLAVSPDLVERVRSFGARDVRLAPVGAEPLPDPTRHRDEVRRELQVGDRPVVLSVGRLHAQKGFDVLLDAAQLWTADEAAPILVIAGDGPERSALHRKATANGVAARWLGYVANRERLADLMTAADVVVVPSRWEGSPLAVHEALLAGRPVVTTAVGGLPELLRPDEVVFVPANDPRALATAIAGVLADPTRAHALSVAARRAAERWPDARAAARRVIEVYDELAAR